MCGILYTLQQWLKVRAGMVDSSSFNYAEYNIAGYMDVLGDHDTHVNHYHRQQGI